MTVSVQCKWECDNCSAKGQSNDKDILPLGWMKASLLVGRESDSPHTKWVFHVCDQCADSAHKSEFKKIFSRFWKRFLECC